MSAPVVERCDREAAADYWCEGEPPRPGMAHWVETGHSGGGEFNALAAAFAQHRHAALAAERERCAALLRGLADAAEAKPYYGGQSLDSQRAFAERQQAEATTLRKAAIALVSPTPQPTSGERA